jgi:hypothetical protein
MVGFSDVAETNILKLIYNATAWANMADNAATTPQTNIGVSLHSADVTDALAANNVEATYTGYARVNVARTSGGWTVTGDHVNPVAAITFPAGTANPGTVTHFATAKSNATPPTGAQEVHIYGTVSPNISTGNGVTPQLTTATVITLD